MIYIIAYDINEYLRDYTHLKNAIMVQGDWQHPMDSVWFVRSDKSTADIAEVIKRYIDQRHDHLFVTPLSEAPSAGWMQKAFWRWMKKQEQET